jgi:hypothetical protein
VDKSESFPEGQAKEAAEGRPNPEKWGLERCWQFTSFGDRQQRASRSEEGSQVPVPQLVTTQHLAAVRNEWSPARSFSKFRLAAGARIHLFKIFSTLVWVGEGNVLNIRRCRNSQFGRDLRRLKSARAM